MDGTTIFRYVILFLLLLYFSLLNTLMHAHTRSMNTRRPSSSDRHNSIAPWCQIIHPVFNISSFFSINRRASKRPSAAAKLYYTTSVEAARHSTDRRSLRRRDTSLRPDSSSNRIKCRYEIAVSQLATDQPIVSLVSHRLLVSSFYFNHADHNGPKRPT